MVAASRLTDHLEDNNLLDHEIFHSANKKGRSTETAMLTRIKDDLLRAIDDNASVILVLLALSTTFDTVDHLKLLTRLKCCYGIKGNALAWLLSCQDEAPYPDCSPPSSISTRFNADRA